ncbi:MAG: DNA repair exonuclease [halophilic archaeon J07HX5]|jgi:DNA repair exonuclease|nr:MAG: DNA repair exonuclease [halophilic archaeon J07HX5]
MSPDDEPKTMTRLVHTADTHLGYRQYHRSERRVDFLTAFEQVIDDAVAAEADAVVHAGDLFDDRQPGLPDLTGALSALERLDDADIPFLAVVGNHESKRGRQWLDLFEQVGVATRLGRSPVVVDNVAIYGLDYVPQARRDALDYEFTPHSATHAALVAHGLFEPFEHGDWDAHHLLEESPVLFDTLLLGDDHTPRTRRLEDPTATWLTYPGSTERASAAEHDDRGYNVVVFDDETSTATAETSAGDGVDVRRRGLDTRPFVYVDVELGGGQGIDRVRRAVESYELTGAVVIVTIEGEGEPVMPAAIEEFAADRGALVTRVTDRREIKAEAETTAVSFADPDAAVQDRIDELGLSPVARDVDELVRASTVADSNVADVVESRVSERIEAEPAEFTQAADTTAATTASVSGSEPEPEPEPEPESRSASTSVPEADTDTDASPEPDADTASGVSDRPPAESPETAADTNTTTSTSADTAGDDGANTDIGAPNSGSDPEPSGDTTSPANADAQPADADTAYADDDPTDAEDQATMEEYL